MTIYDACAGGAPHDVEALRAAVADEATWRAASEFALEFSESLHVPGRIAFTPTKRGMIGQNYEPTPNSIGATEGWRTVERPPMTR